MTDEKSQLLTNPDYDREYTMVRRTDARTAIVRALKQYLESLTFSMDGVIYRFSNVFEEWPDAESVNTYPAAVVSTFDKQGTYEDSGLTPSVQNAMLETPEHWLQYASDLGIEVEIAVLCSNTNERVMIAAMLEDALWPVDWMSGFRLTTPFYFNANASYLVNSITYSDNAPDAARRARTLTVALQATIPVLRVRNLPAFHQGGPVFRLSAQTSVLP